VSTLVFTVILVIFVAAAVVLVRRTLKPAIADRLPLEEGERVLLDESDLKVFHRIRYRGVRTHRVRAVLTDKRILLVTGGPEGKHKFWIQMVLDYSTPVFGVPDRGYSAYRRRFQTANGYPTYRFSAENVSLVEERGQTGVQIDVPFPEHGRLYQPPKVIIYTEQAERYRDALQSRG
jgi:hypothetical protein